MDIKRVINPNTYFALATLLGILGGSLDSPFLFSSAGVVSEIFINLLKLVSLPIIFLSIVSTATGMESVAEIKNLGFKVIKYTLLTTVMAASIALSIFVMIDPARSVIKGGGMRLQLPSSPATLAF